MNKRELLDNISEEIEHCLQCKVRTSGKVVAGEGNVYAKLVFVGEAPGKTEAATGRPFVGRSGTLLRSLIKEIGLHESDIFITSVVKYLPDKGTPSQKQIAHGRIHLQEQLDVINPQIVVMLGSVAAQGVLGEKISIQKRRGEVIKKEGKQYVVMFHPSAALRFPPIREKLQKDFQKLKQLSV